MRNKIYLLFSLLFLVSVKVFSQSVNDILKIIEDNNPQIQAGEKYLQTKVLEYKSGNLPEGPELKYGYFPDNTTVKGTKQVFEVSQSFQMPCYYRNQSGYTKLKISEEEYEQDLLRKGILFEAENLLLDYIFLSKKIAVAEKRLKFANDIYNAFMIRLEVGDANALEVNKAKLHAMQV
ncbi:MAG TPA: TolC family protein, partial [Bacteroidales bacterium]|nr:TolC family protein [Bacteroidales bacterium]